VFELLEVVWLVQEYVSVVAVICKKNNGCEIKLKKKQ